jgi:hypothetical protein
MRKAMHLSIKNDEAHRLATEFAKLTGESLTSAVMLALREGAAAPPNRPYCGPIDEDRQPVCRARRYWTQPRPRQTCWFQPAGGRCADGLRRRFLSWYDIGASILAEPGKTKMAPSNEMPEGKNAAVRRSANNKFFIFVLISGILLFATAAGALYFLVRPEYLRIAVGPAGSDDVKLIQAMAQTFARERSHIRLSPIVTDGAIESISLMRQSKIDLAVARGDLEMPADA